MILNQDTKAPITSRPNSGAGAVIGRWLVILIFAGAVGLNVWQYKERVHSEAEIKQAEEDLAEARALLREQVAINTTMAAKFQDVTSAAAQLMKAYDKRDETQRAAVIAQQNHQRAIAAASEQYNHSRPVPVAAATAPAPRAARTVPAPSRQVPHTHPYATPAAATQSAPVDRIQAALKPKIERFYKTQRRTGSGSTLVFEVFTEYGEPRQIPGWEGRYEVKGEVSFQYYDSVWGGSFSRSSGTFTAEVRVNGYNVEVLELKAY